MFSDHFVDIIGLVGTNETVKVMISSSPMGSDML